MSLGADFLSQEAQASGTFVTGRNVSDRLESGRRAHGRRREPHRQAASTTAMGTICLAFSPVPLSLNPQEGGRETRSLGVCGGHQSGFGPSGVSRGQRSSRGQQGNRPPRPRAQRAGGSTEGGSGRPGGSLWNLDRVPGSEPLKPNLLLSCPSETRRPPSALAAIWVGFALTGVFLPFDSSLEGWLQALQIYLPAAVTDQNRGGSGGNRGIKTLHHPGLK